MKTLDRRKFFKLGGAASLLPLGAVSPLREVPRGPDAGKPPVHFTGDGIVFSPREYVEVLQTITAEDQPIEDRYG